jgi:ADP-heptose:LPS heptosyltransferase
MFPEEWKSVQSVAVLYWGDLELVAQLYPALQELCQALLNVSISLLVPYSVQEINCFIDSVNVISLQSQMSVSSASDELNAADIKNHTVQTSFTTLMRVLQQQKFDAAIVFTNPGQSPYALAYLCYLAGIPLRLGQSQEFGGRVLSTCIVPPPTPVSLSDHHLHLLHQAGLLAADDVAVAIA